MRPLFLTACAALTLAFAAAAAPAASAKPAPARPAPASAGPVRVSGHTAVPGYHGDFDHFAVAEPDGRLFLAGEDGGALEVFDLKSGALVKTIPGFDTPHSLLYLPYTHEVAVIANTGSRVLDARTLQVKRQLKLQTGADSTGYDAARRRAYVVTGGKDAHLATTTLVEIDPYTGKTYGQTQFDGDHTEAMAIEQRGGRIFINQSDKNVLSVVDKKTHTIKARWPIKEARKNAMVALDEPHRRLFVATRDPAKLIVINADTGQTVQALDAPARADQVVWDEGGRRIFVCGGEGQLAMVEQLDADHYRPLPTVATPVASKTCIYVKSLNRLYLAASPGDTSNPAQLVWIDLPRRAAAVQRTAAR
jgi:hypothetical protein